MDQALEGLVPRLEAAQPKCGATAVIAIDGRSGSGKTFLADRLVDACGAQIIRLEDLYGGWDGLDAGVDRAADALNSIASGIDPVSVPEFNWQTQQWDEPRVLAPSPLLIIEGCGAGASELAQWTSLLICVESDSETRKDRAQTRPDWPVFADHWDGWAAQEAAHIAASSVESRADVVVSN
ncbi:MAG: 4-amino-4-deoxy-L-arabinose transferase [Actinobacteria bacterium]|uniref:Unannotated protein n=1 Tax=freshwater metagenome TaxID=449393 RepID=A0A6J7EPS9_9ZZZZ|nr:4-amino-4-deoxy-L-arabinose transferase [Actinomycetota bacterium]